MEGDGDGDGDAEDEDVQGAWRASRRKLGAFSQGDAWQQEDEAEAEAEAEAEQGDARRAKKHPAIDNGPRKRR